MASGRDDLIDRDRGVFEIVDVQPRVLREGTEDVHPRSDLGDVGPGQRAHLAPTEAGQEQGLRRREVRFRWRIPRKGGPGPGSASSLIRS